MFSVRGSEMTVVLHPVLPGSCKQCGPVRRSHAVLPLPFACLIGLQGPIRGPVLEDGILSGKVPATHPAAGLRLPRTTSRPSRGARRVVSVAAGRHYFPEEALG
jgi:hypothetical protein